MGVPVQRILNDDQESTNGIDFKRIHLIEKRDIHNIKRDYNISTYGTKKHENDFISLRIWIEQVQERGEKNPVLFIKHQGEYSKTHLSEDDFCIVIMTEMQAEMLVKFGNDKIWIDGTHGLNNYNFQLYTLLVVDEFGFDFPVAFCFSNKSNTETYMLYYESVKKRVGIIKPSVFMSDYEPAFYNVWCSSWGQFLSNYYVHGLYLGAGIRTYPK